MKKTFLSCILLLNIILLNGQLLTPEQVKHDYYIKKMEKTYITSTSIFLVGGGFIWLGFKVYDNEIFSSYQSKSVGTTLIELGALGMLASVPVFIVAGSYNRKAKKIEVSMMKNNSLPVTSKATLIPNQAGLTIKYPL